jgi:hypothetical protein
MCTTGQHHAKQCTVPVSYHTHSRTTCRPTAAAQAASPCNHALVSDMDPTDRHGARGFAWGFADSPPRCLPASFTGTQELRTLGKDPVEVSSLVITLYQLQRYPVTVSACPNAPIGPNAAMHFAGYLPPASADWCRVIQSLLLPKARWLLSCTNRLHYCSERRVAGSLFVLNLT